jgi:hypothetical protein
MMIGMAKWLCPCGNTIRSSGSIPNPQQWRIVSDSDLTQVASAAGLTDDAAVVEFVDLTRLVYRCESCGRLHVYWDREQTWPPSVYVPEPDAYPQN